jgi:hypothetical protein
MPDTYSWRWGRHEWGTRVLRGRREFFVVQMGGSG